MFEMIMFGVILGIVLILSNLATMFIVMRITMSNKFLDWYIPTVMNASMKAMDCAVSEDDEEDKDLDEIKRKIFEDVDNYVEED